MKSSPVSAGFLGPGVAPAAQTLDRLGDGVVQFVGKPGHEAECLDIAVCDAAAVGAQDAPDELFVLVVFDGPPPPVWCQASLDTESPAAVAARVNPRGPGRTSRTRQPSLITPLVMLDHRFDVNLTLDTVPP